MQQLREREVYSRQQLILGPHGLNSLLSSSLCIVGIDGLGAEVAKNALLAGVPNLILCDDEPMQPLDISTNLCLRSKGWDSYKKSHRTRAEETVSVLQQFNPSAKISCFLDFNSLDLQKSHPNLVIACNKTWTEAERISERCRANHIPFIAAFTGGLYYVYALDFGEDYKFINVQENKQTDIPLLEVTETENNNDGERTFLVPVAGDVFPLEQDDVVDVIDKSGQKIGIARIVSVDRENNTFVLGSQHQIEKGSFIQHVPKEVSVNFPAFAKLGASEDEITWWLVEGLKALDKFRLTHKRLPQPRVNTDLELFFSFLNGVTEENRVFYQRFCDTCRSPIAPVNSIVGGLISEEAVKVLSKSFPPAQNLIGLQFFDFHYQEGLSPEDCTPDEDEFGVLYGSQIYTFGKIYQKKLVAKSALVVGAGALGNEYIKGAAMVGMSTEGEAKTIVVDNDLVMTSNISRQLCFSESDMHKTKADTLCNKVKAIFNPHIRLEPVILKLDHTTEDQIGHTLSQIDVFVTALDNVAARNTVERISHVYNKCMIDGGTEGLEGNQENFIPLKTNEYYNPYATARVVNCTPKPVVNNKEDVIHNAKLHYEHLLSLIAENKDGNLMQSFLNDIKSVWEQAPDEFKNPDGSLKGGKTPILATPTPEQAKGLEEAFLHFQSLRDEGKLQKYFDKDETMHVRLLELMCQIVARTYDVPPPDVMEIRKKAGNIIPSIISTTAIIAGFMLLNTLQIPFSEPKMVNVHYGQAFTTLLLPDPHTPDRQNIHHFDTLSPLTRFKDLVSAIPSPFPNSAPLDVECTLYGNSKVTLSAKVFKASHEERVLKYIHRHVTPGQRRALVGEFVFQKVERVDGKMKIEKKTKFLIIRLPEADSVKEIVKKEVELDLILKSLEESRKDRALEIIEDLRRAHEAELSSTVSTMEEQHAKRLEAVKADFAALNSTREQLQSALQHANADIQRLCASEKALKEEIRAEKNKYVQHAEKLRKDHEFVVETLQRQQAMAVWELDKMRNNTKGLEAKIEQLEAEKVTTMSYFASMMTILQPLIDFVLHMTNHNSSTNRDSTQPSPSSSSLYPRYPNDSYYPTSEPLKTLYNKGNTCFLASMTQLLYVAHVNSDGRLFNPPRSILGKTLNSLFQTGSERDWDAFVKAFFGNTSFRMGMQEDSAKAFEEVALQEWTNVNPNDDVHTIIKTHFATPTGGCKFETTVESMYDHFVLYAGDEGPNTDIARELIAQDRYDRECEHTCGKIEERSEYIHLPNVLIMLTTAGPGFLHVAAKDILFPTVSGKKEKYSLIGASLHSGYAGGGHYTALVKHRQQWFSCSDSSTNRIDLQDFINRNHEDVQLLVFKKE